MIRNSRVSVYITIINVADAHIRFQINSLNHFQNPFKTSLHSYRACNFGTRGTLAGWLLVVFFFSKKSNIKPALFQHTLKLQCVCSMFSWGSILFSTALANNLSPPSWSLPHTGYSPQKEHHTLPKRVSKVESHTRLDAARQDPKPKERARSACSA